MTLKKAHFARSISRRCGYPKNRSAAILETLLELIKFTLASGESLTISGFGKFCLRKRGKRGLRVLSGREAWAPPVESTVTFRCSTVLKNRINRSRSRPVQTFLPRPPKAILYGNDFPISRERGTAREQAPAVMPD